MRDLFILRAALGASTFILLQEEVISTHLLFMIHLTIQLIDPRSIVVWIPPKRNIKILQELIAPGQKALGSIGACVYRWLSIKDNDSIGEVCRHEEIVLDDESGFLAMHDESFDDASGHDTLFRVEVCTRLVDQVDIRGDAEG